MREIASAGVGTIVVSWWGFDSPENERLLLVEQAATRHGLEVAIHVEPYRGRTPARAAEDIAAPPATRAASRTSTSTTPTEIRRAHGRRRSHRSTACASSGTRRSSDGRRRRASTASTRTTSSRWNGSLFKRLCTQAHAAGLLCAPSVGPGLRRAPGDAPGGRAAALERRDVRPHVEDGDQVQARPRHRSRATTSGRRARRSSRRGSRSGSRATKAPGERGASLRSARISPPRCAGQRGCAASQISRARSRAGDGRRSSRDPRDRGRRTPPGRPRAAARAARATRRGCPRGADRAPARDRPPPARHSTSGSSPLSRSSSTSPGTRGGARSSSRNDATATGERAPTNSETTRPSLNAFTAGMPWTRNVAERPGFASTSTFASVDRAVTRGDLLFEHRRERAARAAPGRPEVDDDGSLARALDHVGLEGRLRDVHTSLKRSRRTLIIPPRRRRRRSRRGERRRRARTRHRAASGGRGRSRSRATHRARASALRRRGRSRTAPPSRRHRDGPSDDARCPRARAAPRTGRCARSSPSRCRAGSSACAMRSAGRKPSPRSASVVGQTQIVAPDEARRSSSAPSACVACTTVVRSVRQPVRARSSIGRQPCSARHSSISFGCSSAWMWSGSPLGRRVAPDLLEPVGRARANGVGGDADVDPGVAQLLDLFDELADRALAEAGETSARVGDVEEHERRCPPLTPHRPQRGPRPTPR